MPGALLQFLGSLAAILILAWLASRLKLGNNAGIGDDSTARMLADEVVSGFAPIELAVSKDRAAAIYRDADGRYMVLRGHGSHFAGRILDARARAHQDGGVLHIDTGEKRFGTVSLEVDDPQAWAQAISDID